MKRILCTWNGIFNDLCHVCPGNYECTEGSSYCFPGNSMQQRTVWHSGFQPTTPQLSKLSCNWLSDQPELKKGDSGIWSITLPAPEPEIYTYNFVVDGVLTFDPSNILLQRDVMRIQNELLVPGERSENYIAASKRGNLERVWYDSPTIGLNRCMMVYTPYGYDDKANSRKTSPVLYLLHGGVMKTRAELGRTCEFLQFDRKVCMPMIWSCPMQCKQQGQGLIRFLKNHWPNAPQANLTYIH